MDESWTDFVVADGKPVLIVIEGLSMYLSEPDVRKIFAIIAGHSPKATVFVETMSPFMVGNFKEKSIEGSHAKFNWGVKDGETLATMLPDFELAEEHSLVEGMEIIAPIYKVIGKIPAIRNLSNKIIVLEGR